jgi:hypothetical protein
VVHIAFVGNTRRLEGAGWTGEGADGLPVFDAVTPTCIAALLAFPQVDSLPASLPSPLSSCGAPDAGP